MKHSQCSYKHFRIKSIVHDICTGCASININHLRHLRRKIMAREHYLTHFNDVYAFFCQQLVSIAKRIQTYNIYNIRRYVWAIKLDNKSMGYFIGVIFFFFFHPSISLSFWSSVTINCTLIPKRQLSSSA